MYLAGQIDRGTCRISGERNLSTKTRDNRVEQREVRCSRKFVGKTSDKALIPSNDILSPVLESRNNAGEHETLESQSMYTR